MFRNAAEVGEKPKAKRALTKQQVAVVEVRLGRSKRCAGIAKSAATLKKTPADPDGTVPSLPTTPNDRDLKRLQATGPWQ